MKCFSLILLSPKLCHSTSSLTGVWSAPDRRNRCGAGRPPLNGTYCWGLKQSKCPARAGGQVRQKAAASTNPDLLNECNVIQYMGQQSHAQSRATC